MRRPYDRSDLLSSTSFYLIMLMKEQSRKLLTETEDECSDAQVLDLQIHGAIIWAIAGLALVAVLEYLSTLHKLKEEAKTE